MKMRILLFFCVLVMSVICNPVKHKSSEQQLPGSLPKASNDFGTTMLRLFPAGKNIVFSPISLSSALAMLYAGSQGDTKEEMASVLHFKSNGLQDVPEAFRTLLTAINKPSNGYNLSVANGAYFQKGLPVQEEYLQNVKNNFGGDIRLVDFATNPEGITKEINEWVKARTGGNIPNLLEKNLSPNTVLALLNAVYFKGLWNTSFDPVNTVPSTFYNNGQEPVQVDMMFVKSHFRFLNLKEANAEVLDVPYVGGETSMLIVLPKSKTGVEEVLAKLSISDILRGLNTARTITIDLSLPKFEVESSLELVRPLIEAGMASAFNSGVANFSGITGSPGLALSEALQKAKIQVDEKGTVAAAATVLTVTRIGGFHYSVNHPFLFFIVHRPTSSVLFSGKIVKL